MNGAAAVPLRKSSPPIARSTKTSGASHHLFVLRSKYQKSARTPPLRALEVALSNSVVGFDVKKFSLPKLGPVRRFHASPSKAGPG